MVYIILFLILLTTNCFKWVHWSIFDQNIYRIVCVIIFSFLIIKYKYIGRVKITHKWLVLFLTLMPLISVVFKQIYYHEPITVEFDFTFVRYAIFPLFFILSYRKVTCQAVLKEYYRQSTNAIRLCKRND